MNYDAKLARYLATSGMIDDVDIVDVGCSGGVDAAFRQLEPCLAGVGIDPLVTEVERLSNGENNPNLKYISAYVVSDRNYPARESIPLSWFYRSSAVAVLEPTLDAIGMLISDKK
jgi:hypothetical protein